MPQALRTCEIAHLACHGVADALESLRGKLLLWDQKNRPLTMGFLMRVDLDRCRLVNLSARDVAVNWGLLLLEEGPHLAGAFQMAGVPSVLGTMRSTVDHVTVAPQVSRGVYRELVGNDDDSGRLEVEKKLPRLCIKPPRACGRRGKSAMVWGPYVHFGTGKMKRGCSEQVDTLPSYWISLVND